MSATPVTAALFIDGVRVADGSPGDADQGPVALSDLRVSWGRSTTVDQIDPSTCTFQILDTGPSHAGLIAHVGSLVSVRAYGATPAPLLPANRDPSFESAAVGSVPPWLIRYGQPATITDVISRTGAHSARVINGTEPLWLYEATIPPAPPSPNVSAWDDLPRYTAGAPWVMSAWVYLPPTGGASLALGVAGFTAPGAAPSAPNTFFGSSGGLNPDGTVRGWQQVTRTVGSLTADAQFDGQWLGVVIRGTATAWTAARNADRSPTTWEQAQGAWSDWSVTYVDDVQILPPAEADIVHREVAVFDGRITDVDAGYDSAAGGVLASVVAADFTADLAGRDISAPPWPAQSVADRFAAVLAGATPPLTIPYTLAPTLAGLRVSWLDVDRQQAWPLLADLATSVDGVLWAATHLTTGPYLWLADPRTQAALYVLREVAGLVTVQPTAAGAGAITLDACDVLLDPVVFRQSTSDVATRVALTWQEQTTGDGGRPAPTERTVTVIDPAAELVLGTRRVGVSTMLASEADARSVAELILARLRVLSWRVGGLTWRTDTSTPPADPIRDPGNMSAEQIGRALDLLDGTRRLGAAVRLVGVPAWAPAGDPLPLLVQGGTYSYIDGQWTLDLVTSSAFAQGASLPWSDLSTAWAWTAFSPDVSWSDLVGIGPAPPLDRAKVSTT